MLHSEHRPCAIAVGQGMPRKVTEPVSGRFEMERARTSGAPPRQEAANASARILFVSVFLSLAVGACASAPQPEGASSLADRGPAPEAVVSPEAASRSPVERSVLDGVFARSQASRGQRTFQQVCGACHGINEFSGGRFRIRWRGQTVGDVFDLVSMMMPEDNPGSLTPDEYTDVLAYMLSENGYPPGEVELPADADALRAVRLE